MKVVSLNLPAGCGSVGPKPDHTNRLTQALVSIDEALRSSVASTPEYDLFDAHQFVLLSPALTVAVISPDSF